MQFELAELSDTLDLQRIDKDVSNSILREKINKQEVLVCRQEKRILAFLRYSLFWDKYPFINLIKVESKYQGKGIGSELVEYWEIEMSKLGHTIVMSSTQTDETAQYFFKKLGYNISGSFKFPSQEDELILIKELKFSAQPVAGGDRTRWRS